LHTNAVMTTNDMFLKSNSLPPGTISDLDIAETLIPVFVLHVPVTRKPFCVKSTSSNSMSVRKPSWSNFILPVSPLKSFWIRFFFRSFKVHKLWLRMGNSREQMNLLESFPRISTSANPWSTCAWLWYVCHTE